MIWPDLTFGAVNLPLIGSDPALIPLADCKNCKWSGQHDNQWCYMFDRMPGERCGQFKKVS